MNCGDDPTGSGTAGGDVQAYYDGLPPWATFSPPQDPADTIVGEALATTDIIDNVTYDCVTAPYSITQTPDRIVTLDPDANILWLGALLQGDGYKDGIGSLQEWAVRERAPLTISIDLLAAQNSRTVENPTLASVTQAVGELVNAAEAAGHHGGSSVSFSQETTHDVNQAALKMGLSAGYMSVSVKASLSASRTAAERTITAYFVQRMFTVSVVMPARSAEFFSADFSPARLQEEIDRGNVGTSNLPVYVANIAYGRILMFSFTSTSNITDIRAALAASFSSIAGAEIEGRYLDILNKARISVVTVGGEGRNATALIQSGQLRDYFNEEPALTSARPISYTVRNLGDNSIARVAETTEYQLKECTAIPTTGQLRIDVSPNDASVSWVGPAGTAQAWTTGDQHFVELLPGGYSIVVGRANHDTLRMDTTITAGQTTEVIATLVPTAIPPTGATYAVTLRFLYVSQTACTGETEADVYYDFAVNGTNYPEATRAEASSVPVNPGGSVGFGSNSRNFDVRIGQSLAIIGNVWDDDPIGNPSDLMAGFNLRWSYPSIPTGDRGDAVFYNGCGVGLHYTITKVADLFN